MFEDKLFQVSFHKLKDEPTHYYMRAIWHLLTIVFHEPVVNYFLLQIVQVCPVL